MSGEGYTGHIRIRGQGVAEFGEGFIKLRIKAKGASKYTTTIERIYNLSGRDVQARMFQRLNALGAHLVLGKAQDELWGRIQDGGNLAPSFTVATKVRLGLWRICTASQCDRSAGREAGGESW